MLSKSDKAVVIEFAMLVEKLVALVVAVVSVVAAVVFSLGLIVELLMK